MQIEETTLPGVGLRHDFTTKAGRQLGISPRTIEVHRARIMEKLGAKNTADLIRIALSERPNP